MKFVIAGNHEQFNLYIRKLRELIAPLILNTEDYVYITEPSWVLGRYCNEIIKVGTWYARKNIKEILEICRCALIVGGKEREEDI